MTLVLRIRPAVAAVACVLLLTTGRAAPEKPPAPATRTYENRLVPLAKAAPILADYPDFVSPIREARAAGALLRFEAPPLVEDAGADLHVRAWRWSYNARGIIEIPNRLKADRTAVIVVHPWAIDDGQGWNSPEPAGAGFFCTPEKNRFGARHMREVVDPFLKSLRGKAAFVMYSLPGKEDAIRRKLYRSHTRKPSAGERAEGAKELKAKLASFTYRAGPLPGKMVVSKDLPVRDYFEQFPGLDAGRHYNGAGFWDLPVAVHQAIAVDPDDVVIYDGDGYPALRDYLKKHGVRHVLLTGYNTDMCYCKTTAGYENLSRDFNVFLVGDASLATYPANALPNHATNAALSFAALNQLVTQVSWVRYRPAEGKGR